MKHQWVRDIREQCSASCVPFFFKQGSQFNWPHYKDAVIDGRQWRNYPSLTLDTGSDEGGELEGRG